MESHRLAIAHVLEEKQKTCKANCFIGFDGVSDEILDVVATRKAGQYTRMDNMKQLGEKILNAAGKSCNIELVTKQHKLGGNGPILANALLEGGHDITFVGTIGDPVEPLFQEMASRCKRVVSLGPSAYTQALEFHDGKVMLGKIHAFDAISFESILSKLTLKELIDIHENLDLFVSANWTMLLGLNGIWRGIITDVIPHLSDRPRWMFVDLADPAKRNDQDILSALKLLQGLTKRYKVVLGLNESEEGRIAKVLGVESDDIKQMAENILKELDLTMVVCHSSQYGIVASKDGIFEHSTPYTPKPKITTGAGDNFNAGFCNGLLFGFPPLECVILGVATSGFYVRNAHSPNMSELSQFLRLWQAEEL